MQHEHPADVDAVVHMLRRSTSATNHESLVNRCHVAADELERLLGAIDALLVAADVKSEVADTGNANSAEQTRQALSDLRAVRYE